MQQHISLEINPSCELIGNKSDTEALRNLFLGLHRGECGGAGRRCADVRTQPRCGL